MHALSFTEQLRGWPFVPTAAGPLRAPSALFDPDVSSGNDLIDPTISCPRRDYMSSAAAVDALHALGVQAPTPDPTPAWSDLSVFFLLSFSFSCSYIQ